MNIFYDLLSESLYRDFQELFETIGWDQAAPNIFRDHAIFNENVAKILLYFLTQFVCTCSKAEQKPCVNIDITAA